MHTFLEGVMLMQEGYYGEGLPCLFQDALKSYILWDCACAKDALPRSPKH